MSAENNEAPSPWGALGCTSHPNVHLQQDHDGKLACRHCHDQTVDRDVRAGIAATATALLGGAFRDFTNISIPRDDGASAAPAARSESSTPSVRAEPAAPKPPRAQRETKVVSASRVFDTKKLEKRFSKLLRKAMQK